MEPIIQGEVDLETALTRMGPTATSFMMNGDKLSAVAGGFRCVAPETRIGEVPIAEWQGGSVPTLLGVSPSSRFVLKPNRADLYEVLTQQGKRVVVTLQHRFLTPTGWRPLFALRVGASIAVGDTSHEAPATGTAIDFQDYYWWNPRPSGELPLPVEVVVQDKLRQLHRTAYGDNALAVPLTFRPSSFDDIPGFVGRVCDEQFQERVVCGEQPHVAWDSSPSTTGNSLQSLCMFLPTDSEKRLPAWASCATEAEGVHTRPYPHFNQSWVKIKSIRFLRHGQFYDIQVPGAEHYIAEGLVHHNSGKSVAACAFEIMLGKELPGTRHLIGRLNMPALKQTTLKTFLGMFPLDWLAPNGWKEGDSRLINKWGSEYLFRHLDVTDAAVEGWMRSLNLTSFLIDQAEEVSEGVFLTLVGRLSQPNAPRHFGRLVLNPAGQDWIWQRFFDPKRPDLWKRNSGFTIPTAENEHNLPQGYIDQLRATYPADWYERFVMGSFADFSDKVYADFDMRIHVYDDTKEWEVFGGRSHPPDDWPVIVGLDFGGIDPWAFVFIAVDPVTGFLYQFGEIYLAGILGRQFADRYFDMMGARGLEGLAYDYENTQMAYEMADFGVVGVPAVKDIIPGVMKVGQYLHPDANIANPFTGLHPSPRYFIAQSCSNTIREHVGWKWARDRRGQQTGQPADRDNHTCDAVRYAIHTFRPEPKDIPPPKRSDNPNLDLTSRLFWRDVEREEERLARGHKVFYNYRAMTTF